MIKNFLHRVKSKIFLNRDKRVDQPYFTNALEIDTTTPADGKVGQMIKVVPVGLFPTHPDGPHEITVQHVQEMAANILSGGTDILFDFGHESLWNPRAEAAGWSPQNKVQAMSDGLYVQYPEFTTTGQEKINGKAYRYFSPVYLLNKTDKSGKEIGAVLHSIGLVNKPYMDTEIDNIGNFDHSTNKDKKMNPSLLNFLGLAENATDTDVLNLIKNNCAEYGLPETATLQEYTVKVIEKAKINSSVSQAELDALKADLAAMKAKDEVRINSEITLFVEQAVSDGKILPALKDQFIADAKKNFEAVKTDLNARAKNSAIPGKLNPEQTQLNMADPKAIANAAKVYMNEQAKLGITISYTEAVNAVYKKV